MAKVSVIMGAYNSGGKIVRAISSIQNQTYKDWELIVCNDCSMDDTASILKRLADEDSRIIYIENEVNKGLGGALNNCIAHAEGVYLARMDDDDLAMPERLQMQVDFLDNHPEYALVGSTAIMYDGEKDIQLLNEVEHPVNKTFLSRTPFLHPTTMLRTDVVVQVGIYDEKMGRQRLEDVDLFARIYAEGYKGYNIQEPLLRYFMDAESRTQKTKYRYRVFQFKNRLRIYKMLGLLPIGYVYALRPLLVGLLPGSVLFRIKHLWRESR